MTWTRTLQIMGAVLLLSLFWASFDGRQALRILAGAKPGWLAAALGALTLQTLLSAWRWRVTARQLGQIISRRRAVAEYYLAQVVNQSLPGGVVGDAGRALRARHKTGLRRAAAAVAIERLAGQAALLVILLTGAIAATLVPGGLDLPPSILWLVAVLLATGTIGILAIAFGGRLPGRVGAGGRDLRRMIRLTLLSRNALPRQILLNLAITAANLAAFAFCARATGTVLSPVQAAVLVPLILLTMILPLTISGWGWREGAAAALFPLAGAGAAAGLAASLAFGLMFLASSLPGLIVLLVQGRRAQPAPLVPVAAKADP
nr:lysylphosphatidylglycerol synthase transmembrane domain-containing protein [Paracoccus saliphilus]